MKKTNKKGFTIVELVIVIAVVAILAAVLIPTFISLVKQANLSADQQAIRNMNTALQINAIPNGFTNPSDAIDALYNEGWNFGKMQTYSSGFHYAYSHSDNKMYLIDDKGAVIYPEATDKSKLWGVYDNASNEIIDGITNYMVLGNITSTDHFESAFKNDNNYVIDLNNYCVKINGTYSNVKLINGGVIGGTFSTESKTTEYTEYPEQQIAGNNTTYTNVVFNNFTLTGNANGRWSNVTFTDCVFYDSTIRTIGDVTFINCHFINSAEFTSQSIDIYSESKTAAYTVTMEGCTFSGGYRAINVSGLNPENNIDIIIDDCEFNAIDKDKQMIQVARDKVNVTITDTKFNALGKALSLIEIEVADTIFTCTNNTISDDIPVEQYVTIDGSATAAQDTDVTNKLMK